ncbi:MAG: MAPEG family protein [Proteobacteria bacterium]|nr:MAPEG family protein [Pseudomonadota bacterium]
MTITPFYAALVALVYVYLSLRVINTRRSERVGLGDGDNRTLRRAIRAHGNCGEYAPMALLLIAFAEMQGAQVWLIHALGLMLLAGRVAHASGFGREPERMNLRVAGMRLTIATIVAGSLSNLTITLGAWAG